MFGFNKEKRVYLDWAAATPLLPEVKISMEPFLSGDFGNPSAIHKEAQIAKSAVENARAEVARAIQVRPEFVTFTSGGTEANNIAIIGAIEHLRESGRDYSEMEVVTTRIEHPSVHNTIKHLESLGVTVRYINVNSDGKIILSEFKSLLSEKTVLVSCSYANSEIGVVQPLHNIKKAMNTVEQKYSSKILFHVDAAQAPLWLNCQFDSTGADFLTLDAAKCCGPKGVGVLILSRRARVVSVGFGGGQENGLRPGTENVAGVVGAGVAIKKSQEKWKERAELVKEVRDKGIDYILETIPTAILNGPEQDRIANNINISIPNMDTEFAAVVLDKNGFAVSTKSACSGAGGGESLVVKEISNDTARSSSTLRFTLGPETTLKQIKKLADILKQHEEKMENA
jgi:cysteine desulfurase